MIFDWDENKAKTNEAEHEVSFEDATKVFNDEWAIDEFDAEHSTAEEQRYTIIGLADARILRVTYTVREIENQEIFRLISARKAQSKDKANYEKARNEQDR